METAFKGTMFCSFTLFLFCDKNTNLNFCICKGYLIENILQLLPGLQFDMCYVIKARVEFEIAEVTRFAIKNVDLKILEHSLEYLYSDVICV